MSRLSLARLLAAAALSALLLCGCAPRVQEEASASSSAPGSSAPRADASLPGEDSSSSGVSAEPAEPVPPPPQPEPEPQPLPQPEPEPKPEPPRPVTPPPAPLPSDLPDTAPWDGTAYDYSLPAPENGAVDKDYFTDAAFVGDSRTDGFLIYSGIGRGKNLTSNGLSIFKLGTKKALKIDGREYTLLEALRLQQYGKVYLSLGINELGVHNDQGFYDSYCAAIDAIREAQPNAVIYIQGLIPLNEQRADEVLKRDYLRNDHLRIYNDLMKKAAQEKNAVFLDLYSAFADGNGALPYDASRDGVHLNSDYCKKWLTYLQTHTVNRQALGLGGGAVQPEVPVPPAPTEPVLPAPPVEPVVPPAPPVPAEPAVPPVAPAAPVQPLP